MSVLTDKQIISLFQSYKWNELYENLKEIEYNDKISINKQSKLALKAMLLVALWRDNVFSKEILKYFPVNITDPLTHFAISYAYICLGDIKKVKYTISKIPKKYPKWMKNYLELELLGRSFNGKNQIDLARKLTPIGQLPINYIKVALFESLKNEKADISHLTKWITDIKLTNDSDHLSVALCILAKCMKIDDVMANNSGLLLTLKSRDLFKSNKALEALKSLDSLAQLIFMDTNSINMWLALAVSLPQGKAYIFQRLNFSFKFVPHSIHVQGLIASYSLISSWIKGDYQIAYNMAEKFYKFQDLSNNRNIKNAQRFFSYVLKLFIHWQHNRIMYDSKLPNSRPLQVIGESHSLSLSNINFFLKGRRYRCNTNFILGIKMHHLVDEDYSYHSSCLNEYLKQIPLKSDLLFTIGEIDTRPDEGIWQVNIKKKINLNKIIKDTINGYIDFLFKELSCRQMNMIIIQGIPAPNYNLESEKDIKDEIPFLNMIKKVNELLKEITLKKEWYFLDIYSATVGCDGKSNGKWHLDTNHIQPQFYTQADKWLIKPGKL